MLNCTGQMWEPKAVVKLGRKQRTKVGPHYINNTCHGLKNRGDGDIKEMLVHIYLGFEDGSVSKMYQLIVAWFLNGNNLWWEPNGATRKFTCKGFQQQLPSHTTNFMVSTAHHIVYTPNDQTMLKLIIVKIQIVYEQNQLNRDIYIIKRTIGLGITKLRLEQLFL